jgi:hypothetical protein
MPNIQYHCNVCNSGFSEKTAAKKHEKIRLNGYDILVGEMFAIRYPIIDISIPADIAVIIGRVVDQRDHKANYRATQFTQKGEGYSLVVDSPFITHSNIPILLDLLVESRNMTELSDLDFQETARRFEVKVTYERELHIARLLGNSFSALDILRDYSGIELSRGTFRRF